MATREQERPGWPVLRAALVMVLTAILGMAPPGAALAQTPPVPTAPGGIPTDPDQLRNQLSQALAGQVMERPLRLAAVAQAVANESGQLAKDLGGRLAGGQGPNGGDAPRGLDVEVGQLSSAAAECWQRAQRNVQDARVDLDVLNSVLGGQIDRTTDPTPDEALQILQWISVTYDSRKARNQAIEACVEDSLVGLGRLRAYRSLYPT